MHKMSKHEAQEITNLWIFQTDKQFMKQKAKTKSESQKENKQSDTLINK